MTKTETTRIEVDSVYPSLTVPIFYNPETINCKHYPGTGIGVKIAIVDAGAPQHSALTSIVGHANFTNTDDGRDSTGHATMVTGLLAANRPTELVGMAPDAFYYFSKMVDNKAIVRFDAFIASVLWGVIKEVDILVIPLATPIDNPALKAAIQKAINNGICVVASAGNNKQIEYPAAYDGVLSVGALDQKGKLASYSAKGLINLPGRKFETTYLENKYCLATGTSIATAFAAGLCARVIERFRAKKKTFTPNDVFTEVKSLLPKA